MHYPNDLRPALASLALAAGLLVSHAGFADQGKAAQLTGAWMHQVTFRDCATGAELRSPFAALNTFHSDNTAIEQGIGASPAIRTLSHGLWRRTGARTFANRLEFYIFDLAGIFIQRQVTMRSIELSEDGRTLTSNAVAERFAPDGTFLFQFCATETGERLPEPTAP
jgi:hypothetical protein